MALTPESPVAPRGPLSPLPPRHRDKRSCLSFDELISPPILAESGPRAKLPLLSQFALSPRREQLDRIVPIAANTDLDKLKPSSPSGSMVEERNPVTGTVIQRGFPSHLKPSPSKAWNCQYMPEWDLYRKYGDPSTQNEVQLLKINNQLADLHDPPRTDIGHKVSGDGEEPTSLFRERNHQVKVQSPAVTGRGRPLPIVYRRGSRLKPQRAYRNRRTAA